MPNLKWKNDGEPRGGQPQVISADQAYPSSLPFVFVLVTGKEIPGGQDTGQWLIDGIYGCFWQVAEESARRGGSQLQNIDFTAVEILGVLMVPVYTKAVPGRGKTGVIRAIEGWLWILFRQRKRVAGE